MVGLVTIITADSSTAKALQHALASTAEIRCDGLYGTGEAAIKSIGHRPPHLVLVDFKLHQRRPADEQLGEWSDAVSGSGMGQKWRVPLTKVIYEHA